MLRAEISMVMRKFDSFEEYTFGYEMKYRIEAQDER